MTIEERLKAILEDSLNEEIDISNRDALLEETYGMDSMDAVEITDRVEREFDVEIETKSIYKLKTIGDLLDVVANKQAVDAGESP